MILPLRVLGSASAQRISFGLAIGPIPLPTPLRSCVAMRCASSPVERARLSTTNAQIDSPVVSSGEFDVRLAKPARMGQLSELLAKAVGPPPGNPTAVEGRTDARAEEAPEDLAS